MKEYNKVGLFGTLSFLVMSGLGFAREPPSCKICRYGQEGVGWSYNVILDEPVFYTKNIEDRIHKWNGGFGNNYQMIVNRLSEFRRNTPTNGEMSFGDLVFECNTTRELYIDKNGEHYDLSVNPRAGLFLIPNVYQDSLRSFTAYVTTTHGAGYTNIEGTRTEMDDIKDLASNLAKKEKIHKQ